MIPQVFILSLVAVASANIPYDSTNYGNSPSVENYSPRPQSYNMNIDVTDEYGAHQNRREEGDDFGNKRGSYGFIDAFGIARQVDYVADDRGFRAVVRTNEPGTENQNPADVEIISNAAQIPASQSRPSVPAVSQPASVYEHAPGRQSPIYEQATGRQGSVYEQATGRQGSVYDQASGRSTASVPVTVSEISPAVRQSGPAYEQAGGRLTVTPVNGGSPVFRQSVPVYERASGRLNVVSVPVSRGSAVYRQAVPAYEKASGRINVVSVPVSGATAVYRQSVPVRERNAVIVSRESSVNRQGAQAYEQAAGRYNAVSVPVSGGSSIVRRPHRQVHSASTTVRAPSSSSLSSPHAVSLNRAGHY